MTAGITSRSGSFNRLLVVVLLAGLALRVGWGLRLPADEQYLSDLPDQLEYLELGRNLLKGRGLVFYSELFRDELRAYRTPGYPLLVAACGGNVRAVRLVQALLDTATILATYLLGRRWLSRGGSTFGALLVALNPFLVYFSGLILTETLFTAMMIWGMALMVPRGRDDEEVPRLKPWASWGWWTGAVLLVLSVMVRPSALVLPIVLAVGAAVMNRGANGPYLSRWVPPVGTTILLLEMAALLPWGYRNRQVLGGWVLTTTNSGVTLYDGLNPDATGASDQRVIRSLPQLRSMSEVERSQYLSELAWQYAQEHPRRALALAARKVARTWSPVPLSADYGGRRNVLIAAVYMIPFLLLAAVGLGSRLLPGSAKVFLLIPAIYFTIAHSVSVGSLRYRLPADVPMSVLAAASGAAAVGALRRKPRP